MRKLTPLRTLIAGISLIALINALTLGGIVYNRSSEPESQLTLSQREFFSWERDGELAEASTRLLHLNWRIPSDINDRAGPNYFGNYSSPTWLTKRKLGELGFNIAVPETVPNATELYTRQNGKRVYIVLEFNGLAYQAAIKQAETLAQSEAQLSAANSGKTEFQKRAEAAQRLLENERNQSSRLFAVDAALNIDTLRTRYPDRSRYAIVRGEIRPMIQTFGEIHILNGQISRLESTQITIPEQFHIRMQGKPHYVVQLAYGKRLEPWVTGITVSPE